MKRRYAMSRRDFIQHTATGVGAASLGAAAASNARAAESHEWTNWSGSVSCKPKAIETPSTADDLRAAVKRAHEEKSRVRLIGSGHSFTPLCHSDDIIISLEKLSGVQSTDASKREAVVLGGTKLHEMHVPLREAGLAMTNMGDIDRQAIAGAIATGTHGTGRGLGSISTQVIGLTLVTADGEIVECSKEKNPEMLRAAQVSLGALGAILEVRLQLDETYRLHEKVWIATFDDIFNNLANHIAENRHFEFFWLSEGDQCMAKALNPTDRDPDPLEDKEGERIDHSDIVFPSVRSRLFNEIEFSVPYDRGPDCLLELRELMLGKHKDIVMPLEYRTVAADDIYISTAQGRETVTISAHQLAELPHEDYFADCEAIFRNHDGRPHWGKMHTHTPEELKALYPHWDDYHAVRRQLDPEGRFMNDYLESIFG